MTRAGETVRLRDPADDRAPRGRHDGRLNALCWCQHKAVPVHPHDLQLGLTASCGRSWCSPPKGGR